MRVLGFLRAAPAVLALGFVMEATAYAASAPSGPSITVYSSPT